MCQKNPPGQRLRSGVLNFDYRRTWNAKLLELLAQPDKVAKARENLSNLSWFAAPMLGRIQPVASATRLICWECHEANISRAALAAGLPRVAPWARDIRASAPSSAGRQLGRRLSARRRKRASDHTAMAVKLEQYIALAISSAIRLGSSDTPLTPDLEAVLKKSGIVPEKWMLPFEHRFSRAIGGLESLGPIPVRLGQQTVRGIQLIRDAFS